MNTVYFAKKSFTRSVLALLGIIAIIGSMLTPLPIAYAQEASSPSEPSEEIVTPEPEVVVDETLPASDEVTDKKDATDEQSEFAAQSLFAIPQPKGTVTICKVVLDVDGKPVAGVSGSTFSVSGDFGATATFTTPLTLNTQLSKKSNGNDASCVDYNNIPLDLLGKTTVHYQPEQIIGGNWEAPLYNDKYNDVPSNLHFDSPGLFSVFDSSKDAADGEISLYNLPVVKHRTLIIVNKMKPAPVAPTATVKMCKVDTNQTPLSGWTLILREARVLDDFLVPANVSAGVDTPPSLIAGVSYIANALGTWFNKGGANVVDAEYSTIDEWNTHMDGYTEYSPDILELQIDHKFDADGSNWGAYNSNHLYSKSFIPTSTSANFRIFDGTGTTQDQAWFADNIGAISVSVDKGFSGITGEDGCVTFENVPYGTYATDEVNQDGWENVSGVEDEVAIDAPQELFTIVNKMTIPTGTLTVKKYECPADFVPHRSVNGVGGTVPEGCTPKADVGFEYTYDANNNTNNTGPYLGLFGDTTPFTALATTDQNGLSINTALPSAGRYIVRETDGAALAGLYCTGDGDTNDNNNDNQEITFVVSGSTATNCVAYNKAPSTPPGGSTLKVHIYKYLQGGESAAQIPSGAEGVPQFPMAATWSAANIGSGTGAYVLGNGHGGASFQYAADTSAMSAPANYTTSEVTSTESNFLPIGAQCVPGKYRLVGYKSGDTIGLAQAAAISATAPVFTGLTGDKTIIVVNEKCADATNTSSTIVVKAADLAPDLAGVIAAPTKWFFYNDESDTIDNTLGSFVTGPASAPVGTGSAQLTVLGTQRRNIATYQFKNVKLSDIKTLSFSTYAQSVGDGSPSTGRAPYLQFNIDFNNSDTWQQRIAFVPSLNGAVIADTWQAWDAINSGAAKWVYSGALWPGTADAGSTPKTWTQILALYPNAETRATDSWFGFRVGEPYVNGFTGNVDKFVIGIQSGSNIDTKTYDFEPTASPTNTENVTTTGGGGRGNSGRPGTTGQVLGASTGGQVLGAQMCGEYITDYIKFGKKNDKENVTRLQLFLNEYLRKNLAVDGVYGSGTLNAVKEFQAKEKDQVLAPWATAGLNAGMTPTGYVYKTTKRWINMLKCPELNLAMPELK